MDALAREITTLKEGAARRPDIVREINTIEQKGCEKANGRFSLGNFTSLRSLSSRNPPSLLVIDAYLVSAR